MKKFVVSMLALCMAFSLCACNMRESNETTPNTTAPTTEPTEKPATDPVTDEPTKLPLETNTPDPDVDDDHLIDPTDGGKNDLLPDMEGRIF